MKKYMKWFAAIAVVSALSGCARTAPIAQIHTTLAAGYTQEQVKSAILKAGALRQWTMTQAGPDVINASHQSREHRAEVRINYSAGGYDITYARSNNLMASGGEIHKTYNRWVQTLDNDIKATLSAGAKP
ncbi:lipoprotein [Pantoea stewartii]|uniref:lipoprotein n=1 Tax=Pantoea stewartii TaxID=66269 RepID=UPI000544281D|nr:lipoprotein [Pantoea stewartii]KHE02056.1 lipoprotein [Pantoea stewartii]KHN64394.1 lipoprotein [Pantoea stewartii]